MPRTFISYSHDDKPIARRVARRLSAYGIAAWLDERELRLGSVLGPTIEARIAECDVVIAIATAAACHSAWVAKELAFAAQQAVPRPVYPLLVEPVQLHPLFAEHVGLDATDRHAFESSILTLAQAVLARDLPAPDRERLLADVRACAREEPAIAILVDACVEGLGLSDTNIDSVMRVPYHVLDYAINALFDGCAAERKRHVAYHAAYTFKLRGAGSYVLGAYARTRPSHDTVITVGVGAKLHPDEHGPALAVLASCLEPDDQALASFIFHNADSLSDANRDVALQMVCYPNRPPRAFTIDAALQALKLERMAGDVMRMWARWIRDGQFDGEGDAKPERLIRCFGEILDVDAEVWKSLMGELTRRVRRLARTPERAKVDTALDYVTSASREDSPLLAVLSSEIRAAIGSAEWDGWSDRDEMAIYIDEYVSAALGDRDWLKAHDQYKQIWRDVQAGKAKLAGDV